jgi:hypothetical protein
MPISKLFPTSIVVVKQHYDPPPSNSAAPKCLIQYLRPCPVLYYVAHVQVIAAASLPKQFAMLGVQRNFKVQDRVCLSTPLNHARKYLPERSR